MKPVSTLAVAALLALGACDEVKNDPDIQEARTAIQGAIEDDGRGLKQVYNEARATRENEVATNAADDVGP